MSHPKTFRFAPSPNGRLHLGHAYSALTTWAAAQAVGGQVLLRIEDIDRARCKPEFDAAIIGDLTWLGLAWHGPILRQSGRFELYQSAAKTLTDRGLLYPCSCSRTQIAARATAKDPDGAPLYPGTCRHLKREESLARIAAGEAVQWRLDMGKAVALAGPLTFREKGETVEADPARWGDAVIVRKDTPTSYHLSVVIDDADQGVTDVTRGMDLFAATDLHVLLQSLLGLPVPDYAHHGLITDEGAEKLAKSRGSKSLADLRAEGWTPADVRHRLGFG